MSLYSKSLTIIVRAGVLGVCEGEVRIYRWRKKKKKKKKKKNLCIYLQGSSIFYP